MGRFVEQVIVPNRVDSLSSYAPYPTVGFFVRGQGNQAFEEAAAGKLINSFGHRTSLTWTTLGWLKRAANQPIEYVGEAGHVGVEGLLVQQTGAAFGVQQQPKREVGRGFGWPHRVEGEAGVPFEYLAGVGVVAKRAGWDQVKNGLRYGQRFWVEC